MDIDMRTILSVFLGIAFLLTAIRAFTHHRYILAVSLTCLLALPMTRLGLIPSDIAYIFNNIGAFGVMYKINWFLHNYRLPPMSSQENKHELAKEATNAKTSK